MNVEALLPRRHAAPAGWSGEVFDRVTDALAGALVSSFRRAEHEARKDFAPRKAVAAKGDRELRV